MKNKVALSGKDFRDLITRVTKFPGLGMFGGSDLVNLSCADGWFTATSFGVVLAIGRKRCEGELPLLGIDERVAQNFAGIVSDGGKVQIGVSGKEVVMRCGRNEVQAALVEGGNHAPPEIKGDWLKITAEAAERIRYLADIAYNDVTKPELCCVMLTKSGRAIAMDQKAVAVLQTGLDRTIDGGGRIPLPLPLAKLIEAGNSLYVDSKLTVMKAGCVKYSMPSLVQAEKSYPFGVVKSLLESRGDTLGEVVRGEKLAGLIDDALKCLGGLARTEAVAEILLDSTCKLTLRGSNGGARFESWINCQTDTDVVFRIPLDSLARVRPFLSGAIQLSTNKHTDLYLTMDAGWAMFPGETMSEGK